MNIQYDNRYRETFYNVNKIKEKGLFWVQRSLEANIAAMHKHVSDRKGTSTDYLRGKTESIIALLDELDQGMSLT